MSISTNYLSHCGKNIGRLRNDLNLTPKQLAVILKHKENYILDLERGEKNISLLLIMKLSKALQTKPSEIVKGL